MTQRSSPESPENELESQDRAGDSADDLESAKKAKKSDTGLNNEILDEESEDADPELKVRACDGTQGKQSRVDGQEPEIEKIVVQAVQKVQRLLGLVPKRN